MLTAEYFFSSRPSEIQAVFISDLHLSAATPRLIDAFLALLDDLHKLPNLVNLYLLGDWLDAWIGDDVYLKLSTQDKQTHWLHPAITALKQLSANKVQIFIMHGNRDFAISQKLCDSFGGVLIDEPFVLNTGKLRIRLEHGDALCTDDVNYQRYRVIIRQPIVRFTLLHLPLSMRAKLANSIKKQASSDKTQKTASIMDVHEQAVMTALADCDVLLHGHTHRPDVHHYSHHTRMVLGDWRDDGKQIHAKIALLTTDELYLVEFCYWLVG